MSNLGDFNTSATVLCRFNTHKADGTPATLSGTPAISVYKNSLTESTSGVSLSVDYDSRTGLNSVSIDTSSDGTFYATGNDFDITITTGTVDSISVVGTVVGTFSIENRNIKANVTQSNGTTNASAPGYFAPDWAHVNAPTTSQNLSGTTISTSQVVASVSGAVGSVAGNVAGNVVGSVGSADSLGLSALAQIENSVGNSLTSQGYTTSRAPLLDNLDATVSSRTKPADTQAAVTVVGSVTGDVDGKVLGGGSGSISGVGALVEVNDKTGFDCNASSIGGSVQSGGVDIAADTAAIKIKVDHLPDSDIVNTSGKLWVLDGDGNAVAPALTALSTAGAPLDWVDATAVSAAAVTKIQAGLAAAGDEMTLADGAITDAKFTVPTEAAGRPTGILGMLRRLFEWTSNKRDRNRSTGNVQVYGTDNTTVLETQTQSTTGSTDTQTKGA